MTNRNWLKNLLSTAGFVGLSWRTAKGAVQRCACSTRPSFVIRSVQHPSQCLFSKILGHFDPFWSILHSPSFLAVVGHFVSSLSRWRSWVGHFGPVQMPDARLMHVSYDGSTVKFSRDKTRTMTVCKKKDHNLDYEGKSGWLGICWLPFTPLRLCSPTTDAETF